ncbi:MAG TPA: MYXO-CTERM sorting domain-containing protein [Nannocystaceae bacterium]|nr:MYXO-CTERM sorting domain-containing protein [Nannocystaceae bacterium]
MPTDGVIAFRATAYGELADALASLEIAVTSDGVPIAGAIETVLLSTSDGFGLSHELFVVWRPSAPFEASSTYLATITAEDPWGESPPVNEATVTTGAGPAAAFPPIAIGDAVLDTVSIESGPRVCCDDGNDGDCGFGMCAAPEVEDRASLTATVTTGADPLFSQAFVRARAGIDGSTEAYGAVGRADEADQIGLQHAFEAAGSYCLAVELVSLIDGSVSEPVSVCVDNGELVLETGANPQFEGWLGGCIDDPYWEDTNEPYVPSTGESEGEGGSESEGEGGSEGGSEGEGEGSGGQDDDAAKGCGCDVDDRGSFGAGLLALALGLLVRRRRA